VSQVSLSSLACWLRKGSVASYRPTVAFGFAALKAARISGETKMRRALRATAL
jgi:hypothetical protein